MFTCILVPLDGSARAERALPVAARIARAAHGRVLLVRAVVVPMTYGVVYEGRSLSWRLLRDEQEEAQAYLRTVAQSAPLASLPVETVVAVGQAAEIIMGAAAEHGADLVVLTSHGRTGLGRWVLGSVAHHVVHHAPIPVLVLREREESGTLEDQGADHPLRILVPLDGSALAEAALAPTQALAQALAGPHPARLHLMLVVAPYVTMPGNMPDGLIIDGARSYLEQVAQRLRAPDEEGNSLSVSWSVVAQGDIAQGILATAEGKEPAEVKQEGKGERKEESAGMDAGTSAQRVDLIAMATHGQGAVTRWALGSVAERVLHGTTLPLLVVRPPAVAAGMLNQRPADQDGDPTDERHDE